MFSCCPGSFSILFGSAAEGKDSSSGVSTGCQHGPTLGQQSPHSRPGLSLGLLPPLEKPGWLHVRSRELAGEPLCQAGMGPARRGCLAGIPFLLRAGQPVGAGAVWDVPASFQCSLIKVTAGTAGPCCGRSGVGSWAVFALQVWMRTAAFPEVLRGHAGSGDSSGLLPLHTRPSTLFPLSVSTQASQVLSKILGPARARHLLQPPTVRAGGEAAPPRAIRVSGGQRHPLDAPFPHLLLLPGAPCLSHLVPGAAVLRGVQGPGGHIGSRWGSKPSAAQWPKIEPGTLRFLQQILPLEA